MSTLVKGVFLNYPEGFPLNTGTGLASLYTHNVMHTMYMYTCIFLLHVCVPELLHYTKNTLNKPTQKPMILIIHHKIINCVFIVRWIMEDILLHNSMTL